MHSRPLSRSKSVGTGARGNHSDCSSKEGEPQDTLLALSPTTIPSLTCCCVEFGVCRHHVLLALLTLAGTGSAHERHSSNHPLEGCKSCTSAIGDVIKASKCTKLHEFITRRTITLRAGAATLQTKFLRCEYTAPPTGCVFEPTGGTENVFHCNKTSN